MILKLFWCNFILVAIVNSIVFGKECSIDFRKDLSPQAPVFIKNGELQAPIASHVKWSLGEESTLVCNGVRNTFKGKKFDEIKMKCNSNGILTINGAQVNLNDLECETISSGDVRQTNKKCMKNGNIQEIGFNTQSDGFVKYIEVCFNTKTASVVYTRHTIRGKAINYKMPGDGRTSFKTKGMPNNVHPDTSYRQENQPARLEALLGQKSGKKYLKYSFLARGHLSPDKDGIFRTWQLATYMYINVAPKWQAINAGNWVRMENLVRRKAALINDDVQIVTGTSGVLSLQNDGGKDVSITLEDNGIIVPKYFWKVLKYRGSAIAFVTSNNPFKYSKCPCTDICAKYSWPTAGFKIIGKGLTCCCSTNELIRAFPTDVPRDILTRNILTY